MKLATWDSQKFDWNRLVINYRIVETRNILKYYREILWVDTDTYIVDLSFIDAREIQFTDKRFRSTLSVLKTAR